MADVIITGNVQTVSGSGETLPAVAITSSVEEGVTLQGSLVIGGKGDRGDGAAVEIGGNTSGTPALIASGTMQLYGGSNVTLSQNGQTITIIGGAGGGGGGVTPAISGSNGSFSFSTVTFGNLNGLSFYSSNGSIVGSYSVPTQTSFVLSNSNGVSFGTNGSTVTATVATNYQSQGAYLTTAMNSTTPIVQSINGSSGTFSFNTASSLSSSRVGNAITFGLASNITTALQSAGAYLTTARASNDAVGLNTAGTNVTWTVNSSGISLNAGAYLTTAAQSNHSHGNPTLALTNLSGTTASASNGLTISLSAAAGGGGGDGYNILAAGTQTAATTGSVVFSNSNNVSFGMTNSSIITASASFNQTVQTQNLMTVNGTQGNVTISGGNGVTVGNNASTITISVATNYQSQGAYLTTAAQSNQVVNSVNGSTGQISFATGSSLSSSSNGSTITWGLASNITTALQSANAGYLTSQSNQAFSASGGSSAFQTLNFANSNGVTFSNSNGSVIASHNGLTTAMASNRGTDFVQATAVFNGTNASGTIASNAISISVANPSAGVGIAAGTRTATTSGNLLFDNANGVTFGLNGVGGSIMTASHNGITSQTVQTQNMVSINGSTGAISFATGSSLSSSSNGSTITFGLASNITTALQSAGAYLTTAAVSNHSHGFSASGGSSAFQTLNFANSNGLTFSNSNGSVIGSYTVPTVPTVTQYFSATNTTFNGTNVSGSITLNTNGIRLDISAGAGGGGVTPVASASNGSFSFTTLGFSNANNVTFGTSAGSIITASVAAPGAAAEANAINLLGANTAGNTTATGSTIGWSGINLTLSGTNGSAVNISAPATSSLSATGLVSISTNGSTISIGVPGRTFSNWEPNQDKNNSTYSSMGQNSVYFQKLKPEENYSFANFEIRMSGSIVSSSNSQVAAHSIRYGLYSMDTNNSYNSIATSLMAMTASYNSTTAIGFTVSQGAASYTITTNNTSMASVYTGLKHLYLPFAGSMSAGGSYALGIHVSSATTVNTGAMRMALLNLTNINNLTIGKIFGSTVSVSNSTFVGDYAMGVMNTTQTGMPSAVAKSQMTNQVSQGRLYLQLDS